jgi:hypothetical protein
LSLECKLCGARCRDTKMLERHSIAKHGRSARKTDQEEREAEVRRRMTVSPPVALIPWRCFPDEYQKAVGFMHPVVLRVIGHGDHDGIAVTSAEIMKY